MANIDSINKEVLFSLVKKIKDQNSSLSTKFPIKSNQISKKIILPKFTPKKVNYSPKIVSQNSPNLPIKKLSIFKNKFLEKNNIQINKQNVIHLLSEKRKQKLVETKTYKNNNYTNLNIKNYYSNQIMKGRTVQINLEENENKENVNIKNKGTKVIKNSNSEYLGKNYNKNIGKNLLVLKSPKLDMVSLIKNSKSFFKMLNDNNDEGRKRNNINNNININININGNINNKQIKNLFNHNKRYISYYPKKENVSEMNSNKSNYGKNYTEQNNITYDIKDNNNNFNSNKIIEKKHHKMLYLNNVNKLEDEENNNNLNKEKNIKKEKDLEQNNTVNINVNFISNPKNDFINKRITTNENKNHLHLKRYNNLINNIESTEENQNNINLRNSSNINHIKSPKLKNLFNNSYKVINTKNDNIPLRNKSYRHRKVIKTSKTTVYEQNDEEFEDQIIHNNSNIIQIEDLLILEGKIRHLISCLKYENPLPKMCIEWWNFYTYSSYFGKFPKLFPKIIKKNTFSDYQIGHDSILFELLSIILTYEILAEKNLRKRLINNLKELINEIHQNFLIECDYILSKVSNKSMSNLWIKKLKNIILSNKNWNENNAHLNILNQRNYKVHSLIQNLINICSKYENIDIDLDTLSYFNNNISYLPLMELNKYFNFVIRKENSKISKAFINIIKRNYMINRKKITNMISIPYLPKVKEKEYTLVLDLDETLISFQINELGKGIIKMRPGLFNFLRKVKQKYELVVFTAGTKEYAEPIIDIIEKREKFFIKRLYREHTIYRNSNYIKDLSKLGRNLSKIIIVDNMPQNFCLQRDNGILISNYFGQDNGENTLDILLDILLKIAQRIGRDVRNEIKKYKEEILTKITTNLDN